MGRAARRRAGVRFQRHRGAGRHFCGHLPGLNRCVANRCEVYRPGRRVADHGRLRGVPDRREVRRHVVDDRHDHRRAHARHRARHLVHRDHLGHGFRALA